MEKETVKYSQIYKDIVRFISSKHKNKILYFCFRRVIIQSASNQGHHLLKILHMRCKYFFEKKINKNYSLLKSNILLQGLLHRVVILRLAYAITNKTSRTSSTGDGFTDEQDLQALDPLQITHRKPILVSTKSFLLCFHTITCSTS